VLLLRPHVERFQEEYEGISEDSILQPEDWHNLSIYVTTIQTLSDASDLLEGETYPTASSVIPYLDQVPTNFSNLFMF
jgi:hypothetical protein